MGQWFSHIPWLANFIWCSSRSVAHLTIFGTSCGIWFAYSLLVPFDGTGSLLVFGPLSLAGSLVWYGSLPEFGSLTPLVLFRHLVRLSLLVLWEFMARSTYMVLCEPVAQIYCITSAPSSALRRKLCKRISVLTPLFSSSAAAPSSFINMSTKSLGVLSLRETSSPACSASLSCKA